MRDVLVVAAIVALSLASAFALRFVLIEPAAMAALCEAGAWQGRCVVRTLAIEVFRDGRLGAVALGGALLATWLRTRRIAGLALAAGSGALVLYSATLAAPAVLLAALVFARPAR